MTCSMCDKPTVGRGLCHRHYYRLRTQGKLPAKEDVRPADVFMIRIDKTDFCWLWNGTKNKLGYGIFMMPGGKTVRAHRYMYEITHNIKLNSSDIIMHACDNPTCVNPDHLSMSSDRTENNEDCVRKRRNAFGEKNGHCKLATIDVKFIRKSIWPQSYLARIFSISQSQISNIKNGKSRIKG